MYKTIVSVLIGFFISTLSYSQDATVHMMDSIFVRAEINPAYRFDNNVVIQLPSMSGGTYTNGVSLHDILVEGKGINQIKLKAGADEISELNYVIGEFNINLFAVGVTLKKWQFSAGYNWHIQGSMNYTSDTYLLLANGNAPYIGETLDVSTAYYGQAYHEMYFGSSYNFGNITLGARLKFLSGIEDISTDQSNIQLTTDEEIYQLMVETDFVMNTTGSIDYNGINDVNIDGSNYSLRNFLSQNTGLGIDLGIDWNITNKLNVAASVLDIGSITWKDHIVNYTSNKTNTFEGIDILDYIDDDNDVVLEDSLYNLLQFEESSNNYSTSLGTKYIFNIGYKVGPKFSLGLNYYKANNHVNSRYLLSANAQYKVFSWLSIGSGYGISENSNNLIPVNTILHLPYIDAYMSSDNILSGYSVKSGKVANLRLGLQLGF